MSDKKQHIVCKVYMRLAGSSKTFNNLEMELHKHLKFGTLVVLFVPLKIFENSFM